MGEIFRHVLAVLPAFLLACLAVAALPGPSTALFLHRNGEGRARRRAGRRGRQRDRRLLLGAGRRGGLTGLLRANRWLYLGLHVVGAVVLVYLGVSAWRSARRSDDDAEFGAAFARRLPSGRTPAAAFRASLVTIAANPKAAVFAFSFFPQFLPRHGPVFGTTLALASIQLVLDTSLLRRHRAARVPGPALAVPRRDTPPAGTRPGRDAGGARHRPGRRVPLSRPGRAQRDATGRRRLTPRPIVDHERGRCAPLAACPRWGVTRAQNANQARQHHQNRITSQLVARSRAACPRKPDSGHADTTNLTARMRRTRWNAMKPGSSAF
jgi:Putative threonine efflux protein